MILFLKLFLAHLIGDFLMQPKRWVLHKEAKKVTSIYLYLHIIVHFGCTIILLWNLDYWKLVLIIVLSHYVIDLAKLYALPHVRQKNALFFIDQLAHVGVLYVCAYYGNLWEHTQFLFEQLNWAMITALVFVSFPTAIMVGKLLEPMSDQIELDHKSLPNAGKYIGIIERLFVIVFVILGRWEVIGFLIAAKSVFRFNDLKESNSRKLTEYILIGTLLSFGSAILTGIIYLFVTYP